MLNHTIDWAPWPGAQPCFGAVRLRMAIAALPLFTDATHIEYSTRNVMAKPNYSFEKRQKELAKKKKKEEKRKRKLDQDVGETPSTPPPAGELPGSE